MTRLKNLGVEVIGWALLVLAILASPLPLIPSLLLLAALFLLSSRYSWASHLLEKARRLLGRSTVIKAEEPRSL